MSLHPFCEFTQNYHALSMMCPTAGEICAKWGLNKSHEESLNKVNDVIATSLTYAKQILGYGSKNSQTEDNPLQSVVKQVLQGRKVSLCDWIDMGNLEVVQLLTDEFGLDPNQKCDDINSNDAPLQRAANITNDHAAIILQLIKSGGKAKKLNPHPLTIAIENNNTQLIRALLKNKISTNFFINVNGEMNTPLQYAILKGNYSTIVELLKFDPTLNNKDDDGNTQLHVAISKNDFFLLELFVDAGAYPGIQNNLGFTPIHLALIKKNSLMLKILLRNADTHALNLLSNNNFTALYLSVHNNDYNTANILLNAGASPDTNCKDGHTALHYATIIGDNEMVNFLIKKGASLNLKEKKGRTPLHFAALNRDSQILKILIKAGAILDKQDLQGNTALFFAATSGNIDAIIQLLQAGANLNIKRYDGFYPHYFAKQNGHFEVLKLLQKYFFVDLEYLEPKLQKKQILTTLGNNIQKSNSLILNLTLESIQKRIQLIEKNHTRS